jgi:uncharacterized repeat protein (TIGR01451 family)
MERESLLWLAKTADPALSVPAQIGDGITYRFTLTNAGNTTLTDAAISDKLAGLSAISYTWPGEPGTLAPGEQASGTATYQLSQGDIDDGHVANSATASYLPPGANTPQVTPPSSTDTPLSQNNTVTLAKTADPTALSAPAKVGDVITYRFTLANAGSTTVTAAAISDDLAGLSAISYTWPGTPGTLAPGEQATGTASYRLTQADIDAGHVANNATASYLPPGTDTPQATPPSPTDTPVRQHNGLALVKTADSMTVSAPAKAGEVITFRFTARNTGNTTLTQVSVTDELAGLSALTWTWPQTAGVLAPGAQANATADYVVTAADIAAGGVTNGALAAGVGPDGGGVSDSAKTTVDLLAPRTPEPTPIPTPTPTPTPTPAPAPSPSPSLAADPARDSARAPAQKSGRKSAVIDTGHAQAGRSVPSHEVILGGVGAVFGLTALGWLLLRQRRDTK